MKNDGIFGNLRKSCLQCHECILQNNEPSENLDCQQCERCIPCISSFGCDKRLMNNKIDENDVQGRDSRTNAFRPGGSRDEPWDDSTVWEINELVRGSLV